MPPPAAVLDGKGRDPEIEPLPPNDPGPRWSTPAGLQIRKSPLQTERSYGEWIVRFVRFHGMRSRAELFPAEPKIEAFLTDLAVHGNVAAATQNQAMNALVFLYKRVLNHALEGSINAVRADKKLNVPVVMTREEVATVISLLEGTGWPNCSTAVACASWKPSASGSRTSIFR
jgi:hypothetical protein